MPYLTHRGLRLFYTEAGDGDPLLLLMGMTAPGAMWARHAAVWQRTFRCLMPDHRGVGRSARPRGPYRIADMADDQAALLDAVGLAQVRVVGCSMGSAIAQELALRHPSKVRSLVLFCPWARVDAHAAATFDQVVACRRWMPPGDFARYLHHLIYAVDTWKTPEFQAQVAAACRHAKRAKPAQSAANAASQAAACIRHDTYARLAQIACPTLVLAGTEDRFTPPWMAREVAQGIPRSELQWYRGAGHAFHWERLDDVNQRCLAWWRRH